MGTHKLALVPADGVGPEVIDEARKVLEALAAMDGSLGFQYTIYPWGSAYYRETGRMMPEDGLDQLAAHDAILMGAVGDPDIPDHVTLSGILLPIRRGFDQGVCLRPSYLYEGVSSPLAGVGPGDIDLVVFRENTEGEYADVGGHLYRDGPEEVVVQSAIFTRRGTERIMRAAFDYSRKRRSNPKVTSVTKSNAMVYGMVFWDRVFREVTPMGSTHRCSSLSTGRPSTSPERAWPTPWQQSWPAP